MPQNPFFAQHAGTLLPLLSSAVLKWQAADHVERQKEASAKSYMWRSGYYELVLAAVQLVHGPAAATAVAHQVLGLYGEVLEDYIKEFGDA